MSLQVQVRRAIDGFELEAAFELRGHTTLVGPNGCGKSTLLGCIAGIRKPASGRISIDERVLYDSRAGIDLPVQERRVGYVFQENSLFPHMTIAQNIGYPLLAQRRRDPGRVDELLARFRLDEFSSRYPDELSGGEQQRATMARALAADPDWVLLDEPFAALDAAARPAIRSEVLEVLDAHGIPAVLVTHDYEEALGFGRDVVVMERGRVVEFGPTAELLAHPSSPFGAALAGMNHFLGEVLTPPDAEGLCQVKVGELVVYVAAERRTVGPAAVVVAPDEITLALGEAQGANRFPAVIQSLTPEGGRCRVRADGPLPVTAMTTMMQVRDLGLGVGERVVIGFDPHSARLC